MSDYLQLTKKAPNTTLHVKFSTFIKNLHQKSRILSNPYLTRTFRCIRSWQIVRALTSTVEKLSISSRETQRDRHLKTREKSLWEIRNCQNQTLNLSGIDGVRRRRQNRRFVQTFSNLNKKPHVKYSIRNCRNIELAVRKEDTTWWQGWVLWI